MTCTSN